MKTTANEKLYTTTHLDPSNGWQATTKETGYFGQHLVTGPCAWAVETAWRNERVLTHGNFRTEHDARRFAASMGDGDRSKPVQVAPYYYSDTAGRVTADRVHPLCEANATDWAVRPAGAVRLAWDPPAADLAA